ncbi:SHQ1 domain containing protein [Amanita muscaria]
MITPRFSCSQNDSSLIISVCCPSVRASDVEIHVEGPLFTLHINPYFLRLNFPHNLLDDDDDDASSATYDPSSGYLTVILSKEVKGQEFKDLDLLARLLATPTASARQPSIEVLSTSATPERSRSTASERDEILDAARNDWRLPLVPDKVQIETSSQAWYGFLNMHSGYFRHVKHSENEINELGPDAETCRVDERRAHRIGNEDRKFDAEHYMADYLETDVIQDLLQWDHPSLSAGRAKEIQFTDEEKLAMLNLPRKEYLATSQQTHDLYLTLATILFSYAYESRTTQHDPTPESAWTICNLTPAFSALDPPSSFAAEKEPFDKFAHRIRNALIPSYRRSLAFPLYRSFALADACWQDVAKLLSGGKRIVFRCLLEMKMILDHHEVYYVYSKIWMEDFCVWIQACASDDALAQLATCIAETDIKKGDIGWDLEGLEKMARAELEREIDSDDESIGDI